MSIILLLVELTWPDEVKKRVLLQKIPLAIKSRAQMFELDDMSLEELIEEIQDITSTPTAKIDDLRALRDIKQAPHETFKAYLDRILEEYSRRKGQPPSQSELKDLILSGAAPYAAAAALRIFD